MPSNPNATSIPPGATREPPVVMRESDAAEGAGDHPAAVKNVGPVDRILRVALGGALASWAALRLLGGGGLVALLVDLALIAVGLDFVVTGIRGHCPLYQRLGWSTAGRRVRR